MKKTYKNPTVKVASFDSQVIASSMKLGGTTDKTSGNLAPERDSDWSDFEN